MSGNGIQQPGKCGEPSHLFPQMHNAESHYDASSEGADRYNQGGELGWGGVRLPGYNVHYVHDASFSEGADRYNQGGVGGGGRYDSLGTMYIMYMTCTLYRCTLCTCTRTQPLCAASRSPYRHISCRRHTGLCCTWSIYMIITILILGQLFRLRIASACRSSRRVQCNSE